MRLEPNGAVRKSASGYCRASGIVIPTSIEPGKNRRWNFVAMSVNRIAEPGH
jgi:hypothetical protein